jgi:RNA polymerase sigma-70 factor (ECF subfamily)
VARCVAGDAVAWKLLYNRHFPDVERLAMALGVTDAEVDDLCQEIFILVHRHLRSFRAEASLSTWIYRVASRETIRFARRRRLRQRLSELFHRERVLPQDWSEGAANTRHYLHQLLDRLHPDRRLAIVLCEIEGLPVAEVARIAACAENTIWTRLHRARIDLEAMAKKANA